MDVTFQIPDELANRVTTAGDLSRRALEAFALEELRAGRVTEVELRKMLGLERIELDGFLKAHGIYQEYTLEDFEEERRALKELGALSHAVGDCRGISSRSRHNAGLSDNPSDARTVAAASRNLNRIANSVQQRLHKQLCLLREATPV